MSTSNGQPASAPVFNAGYVSRTSNSNMIGVLSLESTTSGANVTNVQQSINDILAAVANLENNLPINNTSAITDPTVNDDATEGYIKGSVWINGSRIFIATNVTAGVAVWKRIDKPMLTIDQTYFNGSLNVDDTAWVELVADSGTNVIKKIQSFYTSGSVAEIGVGALGSEQEIIILQAGGNGETGLEVDIPANSRISIRLKSGEDAVTGAKLAINFFREA